MPLNRYGVLSARPIARVREDPRRDDSPHYQVHLEDDAGHHYRAAVNVLSQESPSELRYAVVDDFRHPLVASLPTTAAGWTDLDSRPGGAALDLIRANVVDPAALRTLPADVAGADNDLADLLDHHVQRAITAGGLVHVWGQAWGPDAGTDKIFGFQPDRGVHDVHMNQGNSAGFARDDGVWQDGGLLVRVPGENRVVAIFLAFQSQAWHTDDRTGHTLTGAPPRPTPVPAPEPVGDGRTAGPVRLVAALVNPVGPAPEAETVTVLNVSPEPVDLTGWHVADRNKAAMPLPAVKLAAGGFLTVPVAAPTQLGNKGGTITVLDDDGLKVHGVAYTGAEAEREGWTVAF
jgi:uncharacterized protein YukJ